MKLPAIQFYPADWRKDPGVQSLTFHARGVWLEIICLMHESPRRGYLLLPNGNTMSDDALSRVIGLDKQNLTTTLTAILECGVADRCPENGAIINRRMVRDEAARSQMREAGKTGGNPSLCEKYNSPGFVYAVKRDGDGAVKIGIAINVENRFRKLKYALKGQNLTLMGCIATHDMGATEKELHDHHRQYCIGGEWFRFPPEITHPLKGQERGGVKGKKRASSSSSSSSSEDKAPAAQDGFERFWGLVPNKIARGAAFKAWQLALKKADAETIITGIPAFQTYESGRASLPDYRPLHPATWLNQERWTDELTKPYGKQGSAPGSTAGRMVVLRRAVEKYGQTEFSEWLIATYPVRPEGEDDYQKARESILVEFLHFKGEKA